MMERLLRSETPGIEPSMMQADRCPQRVLEWKRPTQPRTTQLGSTTHQHAGRDPWGLSRPLSCFLTLSVLFVELWYHYAVQLWVAAPADVQLLNGRLCTQNGTDGPSAWDTSARRPARQSSPALCTSERRASGSRLYICDDFPFHWEWKFVFITVSSPPPSIDTCGVYCNRRGALFNSLVVLASSRIREAHHPLQPFHAPLVPRRETWISHLDDDCLRRGC